MSSTLMKHPLGSIITIRKSLYEVEAARPCASTAPLLAGKTVYSLRRLKDGTRWRVTAARLHNQIGLTPARLQLNVSASTRQRARTMRAA